MNELEMVLKGKQLVTSEVTAFRNRMERFVTEMQHELRDQAAGLDGVRVNFKLSKEDSLTRDATLSIWGDEHIATMRLSISQAGPGSYRVAGDGFSGTFDHPKLAMAAILKHIAESQQKHARALEVGTPEE